MEEAEEGPRGEILPGGGWAHPRAFAPLQGCLSPTGAALGSCLVQVPSR